MRKAMLQQELKAMVALYRAAAREFLRDKMAVLITVLLPVVMAGFFALIFSGGTGTRVELGLAVADRGPVGRQIAQGLAGPEPTESLHLRTGTRDEMLAALEQGEVAVVLVLPSDLSANVAAGRSTAVEVYYDSTQPQVAGAGMALARQILLQTNQALLGVQPLLEVEEHPIQREAIPMGHLYVAGMMGLAALWLGVFATAPHLVQMREQQSLRRIAVAPVRRSTFLAAQVAWRFTVGLVQAALLVALGTAALGLRVVSWPLTAATVVLGTLAFIALGFFLAGVARSNESAVALGQVVQFPMLFLSGALFPLEMLPEVIRPVAHAMPLSYLVDALRQTLVGAAPLYPLWLDAAVLGGVTTVLFLLAVRTFRWNA